MRLWLMRHAATPGNESHRYVGRRTDEPLSDEGRAQCLRAGACLEAALVFASPLARAVETARLCFPHARVERVAGLEEFDFGAFEGHSAQELEHDAAYRAWVDGWCVGRCPGGESREAFVDRSNAALADVLRAADARSDDAVVVVAHGGTIMAALSAWADVAPAEGDRYFGWHVGTCEGYTAVVQIVGERIRLGAPRQFRTVPSTLVS